MDDLSREAQDLITSVGNADGPTAQDRERVKRQLLLAAAASGAAAVASSVTKTAVAAGPSLLSATTAGSGAGHGAGIASSAPVSAAATAANSVTTGAAATTVAAAKVTGTASLLGLGKAAWIAGACMAGAGLTGTFIAQAPVDPAPIVRKATLPPALPETRSLILAPHKETTVSAQNAPDNPGRPVPTQGSVGATRALKSTRGTEPQQKLTASPRVVDNLASPEPASRPEPAESELSLLSQAQRALAVGDSQRALSLADKHAAAFPNSALSTERAAVRVFALCRLGQVEEARRASRSFLKDGHNSPLAPRVQESCISNTPSSADSKTE